MSVYDEWWNHLSLGMKREIYKVHSDEYDNREQWWRQQSVFMKRIIYNRRHTGHNLKKKEEEKNRLNNEEEPAAVVAPHMSDADIDRWLSNLDI